MNTHARLDLYRELADLYEGLGDPSMRDRFLVLAADAALASGSAGEAEQLRQRLLKLNPHHMLKPYSSFAQAMQVPDMDTYVNNLRQNYPPETAEELLRSLRQGGGSAGGGESFEAGGTLMPRSTGEEPRVYPIQQDEEGSRPRQAPKREAPPAKARPSSGIPLPRAQPAPAPAPARPAPARPAPARPAPAPTARPPAATRATASRPPLPAPLPPAAPPGDAAGAWLSSTLFGLFITAAVALAVYTLGRPFLPAGWLP
jgi:hypothetical protein